jgi:hypothetical protein
MTEFSSQLPEPSNAYSIASATAPGGPGKCSEEEMNKLLIKTMQLSQKVGNALNQIGSVMGNNGLSVAQKVNQIQNLKSSIDTDVNQIDNNEHDYDNCNDGDRMRSGEFGRLVQSARVAQASAGQNLGNLQNQMRNNPQFANVPVGKLVENFKKMAGDVANWTTGAAQQLGNFLIGLGAGVLGGAFWVIQQIFSNPGMASNGSDRTLADNSANTNKPSQTVKFEQAMLHAS